MPRKCTICQSPAVSQIDAAIVAGETKRDIARRFETSKDAVARHEAHTRTAIVAAQKAEIVARGVDLSGELEGLYRHAKDLGRQAEEAKDIRAALMAIRELTRLVELQARLAIEAQASAQNVATHPAWLRLRAALLDALRAHPEAHAAVLAAMQNVLN